MILALVLCMGAVFLPVTVHAAEGEGGEKPETIPAGAETVSEIGENPFTPDGQATVTDNATEADGKEFYTFTTPEGNVFYLVIDHERESENVYFLNAVTETDLLALAADAEGKDKGSESAVPLPEACDCRKKCEAGMVDTSCPVCKNDLASCKGKAAENPGGGGIPAAESPAGGAGKENGDAGMYIFLCLAMAAVGGAGYYFKIYKPKHELDDAEDLDELLGDGDEVTEDEEDESGYADADQGSGKTHAGETEAADSGPAGQGCADGEQEDAAYYDDYPDDEPGRED